MFKLVANETQIFCLNARKFTVNACNSSDEFDAILIEGDKDSVIGAIPKGKMDEFIEWLMSKDATIFSLK